MSWNFKNLIGKRFARLTVVSRAANTSGGRAKWNCVCDCGHTTVASTSNLNSSHTKSCGCLGVESTKKSNTTHGLYKHPEYKLWLGMKNRCHNPKNKSFSKYGAKGVSVCSRWQNSFASFVEDMGPRPSLDCSIDRIISSKGYSPNNCRWATQIEQQNNRGNNKKIIHNGQTLTLAQWSRFLGGNVHLVHSRLSLGWTEKEAVTIPKGEKRKDARQA